MGEREKRAPKYPGWKFAMCFSSAGTNRIRFKGLEPSGSSQRLRAPPADRDAVRLRIALQRALDVVQMLLAMDRAGQVEAGLDPVDRRQQLVAQRRDLPIGLLGEPQREPRRVARRKCQAERLGRLIYPFTVLFLAPHPGESAGVAVAP